MTASDAIAAWIKAEQARTDALEAAIKAERDAWAKHNRDVERMWAAQRERAVFDRLDRGAYTTRILTALSLGAISIGKACEALNNYIHDGTQDPFAEKLDVEDE